MKVSKAQASIYSTAAAWNVLELIGLAIRAKKRRGLWILNNSTRFSCDQFNVLSTQFMNNFWIVWSTRSRSTVPYYWFLRLGSISKNRLWCHWSNASKPCGMQSFSDCRQSVTGASSELGGGAKADGHAQGDCGQTPNGGHWQTVKRSAFLSPHLRYFNVRSFLNFPSPSRVMKAFL